MSTTSTEKDPHTAAAGAGGTILAPTPAIAGQDVTLLDISDPQFMATAYDTYNELRNKERVSVVRFAAGNPNPHETDEERKQRNPREEFFTRESFFVTHYDDVVTTLLDDRYVVDPRSMMTPEQRAATPEAPEEFRPLTRSLLSLDPPDHTRIRKLVQPSFTGRGMEAMRPAIQQVADTLLDRAEAAAAARGEEPGHRQMELIRSFAYPFPVAMISNMLGIPQEDREQIRGWTENLLRVDRGRDEAMNEQVRQGLKDFTTYLQDLFERKRQQPGDDMISRMVVVSEDGDVLSEEEMLATVFLMYLAGHVTTVNLIGSGVVAVLSHPEQEKLLREDLSLSKNLVEETLRYWGPVDFIGRRFATENIDLEGIEIPRGSQVAVSLGAANRDPGRFAEPDVFDITRADANRHVAFGRGIHV
ncbi:MAG: cytochrome P450, partial [Thermomicrobiales bacterium]|nr:cytochrome P450 [Thermomicrobiales bacterium]